MKRQEKEILYNKFTNDFGANFEKACFIIKYLSTYPELTSKISNIKLLNIEDIKESQLEWISLVNQLEHPLEIEFFKTYWVPIQCDGYDYFIDLSSETFSLFEINYFPFKPYNWSINNIFQNISDLLLVTDENKIEIKSYMNKIKQQNLKKMLHFVNGRHRTMWMADVLELEKVPVLMTPESFAEAVVDGFVSASDIGFEGMPIPGMMKFSDIIFSD